MVVLYHIFIVVLLKNNVNYMPLKMIQIILIKHMFIMKKQKIEQMKILQKKDNLN